MYNDNKTNYYYFFFILLSHKFNSAIKFVFLCSFSQSRKDRLNYIYFRTRSLNHVKTCF